MARDSQGFDRYNAYLARVEAGLISPATEKYGDLQFAPKCGWNDDQPYCGCDDPACEPGRELAAMGILPGDPGRRGLAPLTDKQALL